MRHWLRNLSINGYFPENTANLVEHNVMPHRKQALELSANWRYCRCPWFCTAVYALLSACAVSFGQVSGCSTARSGKLCGISAFSYQHDPYSSSTTTPSNKILLLFLTMQIESRRAMRRGICTVNWSCQNFGRVCQPGVWVCFTVGTSIWISPSRPISLGDFLFGLIRSNTYWGLCLHKLELCEFKYGMRRFFFKPYIPKNVWKPRFLTGWNVLVKLNKHFCIVKLEKGWHEANL